MANASHCILGGYNLLLDSWRKHVKNTICAIYHLLRE
jgi:hypothetical protein